MQCVARNMAFSVCGDCSLPTCLEPTSRVWNSPHCADDREEGQRASGVYLKSHIATTDHRPEGHT